MTKASALTAEDTPADTDIIYWAKDAGGGSFVPRKMAYGDLKAALAADIGGGGGGLFDISAGVPAASNWTWFNQGSATRADSSPAGKALRLVGQGGTTNNTIRGLYKAVPSTPYTITALLLPDLLISGVSSIYPATLFGFTDGTKLHAFYLDGIGTGASQFDINVSKMSNATTYVAAESNTNIHCGLLMGPLWLQIEDDGTNVYFRYGTDSVNFTTLFSVAKASGYLGGSGYTNNFFGISDNNPSGYPAMAATLRVWDTTARAFP